MVYELILPVQMTVDAVVDQLARAVWRVLASDRDTWGLYQGYFVTVYDAIHDHLNGTLEGEQLQGGVRSLKFAGAAVAPSDAGLDDDLARAVCERLREVLAENRTPELVHRVLPEAIREVLEPYLWMDAVEGGAPPSAYLPPRAHPSQQSAGQ